MLTTRKMLETIARVRILLDPIPINLWLRKITARELVRSMVDSLEAVERRFEPRRVKLWLRGPR